MTHKKIVEFDEVTSPADGDLFLMVDVSDTTDDATGSLKKIQKSNFLTAVAGLTPDYGEMYFTGNTSATVVSVLDTWYPINATYVSGELNGFTRSGDTLTCTNGGTFHVVINLVTDDDTSNLQYNFGMHVDGVEKASLTRSYRQSTNQNTNLLHIVCSGLVVLSAGEALTIELEQTASTPTNIKIKDASLVLVQVA